MKKRKKDKMKEDEKIAVEIEKDDETLGEDAVRNEAIVIPLSVHVGEALRIFTGPGYEWHDNKEKYLWRVGVGYEFGLGGHWSIAPELLVDMLENGDNTWLAGVAIGYHF